MESDTKTGHSPTSTLAMGLCPVALPLEADTAETPTWRDSARTPDERARDILSRLTLEEKVSLLHADGTFTTPGLPRFNIPKLWMSDGPQGVREELLTSGWDSAKRTDDFATAMPANIALAASFDLDLARAFGDVLAEEAVTRGKNIMLGPGVNMMRTPLNGRNCEYLGEDPYLAGRMAVGFIEAIQSHGVAACVKHYALNNQETSRGSVDVHVDERTMREIYLPAFKASVKEAHVWSVMTAYNRVNGQYCSENEFLLQQVLKTEWKFQGLVMTDWAGCHSTEDAANNGLDLEMGTNVAGDHNEDFFARLPEAVKSETVSMSRIDDMALRNLRVMAAIGLLDGSDRRQAASTLMSPEHIEIARKVAEAGCVLLKNHRQILPLEASKIQKIAVIGQNADTKFAHDGNSAGIKTAYEITPLEGITKRAGNAIKITYAQGYVATDVQPGHRGLGGAVNSAADATTSSAPDLIAAAVDAARDADVVLIVAGLYRSQDQEGQDRPDMNLPAGQAELIEAVSKVNFNTVVVLTGGSPSSVDPWLSNIPGLLMYWYGGTEGGNALARILFGDVNPSGHLPITFPKMLLDSPAHANADPNQFPGVCIEAGDGEGNPLTPETFPKEIYSEGLFVGYRWFDAKNIEPQFPFGFGLSYTQFEISDLKLTSGPDGEIAIKAMVRNVGTRAGGRVIQVYVQQDKPNPAFPRPPRELKAFKKIFLGPGTTGEVTMSLDASSFAYYNPAKHAWMAQGGDYTIHVGDSSRNLPLKATFNLPQTISITE